MIVNKKNECEKLIINNNYSILNNFKYKKTLNDFYNPEEYLFFVDGEDVIPLVVKDSMVTFYGGVHYNEYNLIPKNKKLLNKTIEYLKINNLDFKLLSITNDYYDYLKYKKFDVPYSPTWIFENINNFNIDKFLNIISKKKRYKINRILKNKNKYTFENLDFNTFKDNIQLFLTLHIEYFTYRGLTSGWKGKNRLFSELIDCLNADENLFIKIVKRNGQYVGIYILAYNDNEMIYVFGGTFDKDDENISMLIYFDILENSKIIANKYNIKNLDAMRGSFGYKKKLNFKPKALYALVSDNKWIPNLDVNLTKEDYYCAYGREFGVFGGMYS